MGVTPSTIAGSAFTNGVWTGNVTATTLGSGVVLAASDGAGHTGASNTFDVIVGPLHHFAWSTISSPQIVDTPLTFSTSVNVTGGTLMANQSVSSNSISATDGGLVRLTASNDGNRTIKAGTIAAPTGKIDLTNNKGVVTTTSLSAVSALVGAGRNGGTWDGNGIMTSRPDADTLLTGIGVAPNTVEALGAIRTSHGDQNALTGGETLLMYTYVGDQNLDGDIDGDDYAAIDAGFSVNATTYHEGDFNFSGNVDADDYWLIDRNYGRQSTPLAPAPPLDGVTAVPEPGTLSIVALVATGLLRRRRRR